MKDYYTNADIREKEGISNQAIANRIKKLESRGVIVKKDYGKGGIVRYSESEAQKLFNYKPVYPKGRHEVSGRRLRKDLEK